MKQLNLKLTNKKSLANLLLIITFLSVGSGCSQSTPKEKVIITNNFVDIYVPLPETDAVKKDIETISEDLYKYIMVNEITYVCSLPKDEKERDECWNFFLKKSKK